jgi:hypothetical protein
LKTAADNTIWFITRSGSYAEVIQAKLSRPEELRYDSRDMHMQKIFPMRSNNEYLKEWMEASDNPWCEATLTPTEDFIHLRRKGDRYGWDIMLKNSDTLTPLRYYGNWHDKKMKITLDTRNSEGSFSTLEGKSGLLRFEELVPSEEYHSRWRAIYNLGD